MSAASSFAAPTTEANSNIATKQNEEHQLGEKKIREKMRSLAREGSELEELILIDAIQRLGLECYFHEDINDALARHYKKCITWGLDGGADLYEVSLRFRLLRQAGFHAPAGIFNMFKGRDGVFKRELCNDIEGLLSLFEASQLSTHGECVLNEAGEFSERQLKYSVMNHLNQPWVRIVENTLRNPFHKSSPRLLAGTLLKDFKISLEFSHGSSRGAIKDWVDDVQCLAEVDYHLALTSYRNEIQQVLRWAEKLNSTKQLDFARIKPLEWYIWPLGTLPEPNMAEERIALTKAAAFVYILDDIFDVYGTLDEVSLFTEAIHRWDAADTKALPDYMKVCFSALQDLVKDISHKTRTKHGWNPEELLQKSWADLCKSFLVDAKWLASKHLPTSDEYLRNALVSFGGPMFLTHAFCLLGRRINKESIKALNDLPLIVSSVSIVGRLWNDIGTQKAEKREGFDGSYIDCYMKEHNISSVESATKQANQIMSNSWKHINEEWLSSTSPFSLEFKRACLNLTRVTLLLYTFDAIHSLQSLQKCLDG